MCEIESLLASFFVKKIQNVFFLSEATLANHHSSETTMTQISFNDNYSCKGKYRDFIRSRVEFELHI